MCQGGGEVNIEWGKNDNMEADIAKIVEFLSPLERERCYSTLRTIKW